MLNYLTRLLSLLLLLAPLALLQGCGTPAAKSDPHDMSDPNHDMSSHTHALGGDFALTDFNEQEFKLDQQRGKVVLLFFGYTSCADACPTMLSKLKKVYAELGDGKSKVQTVFVSVDPGRDTPKALKDYLDFFSINAIGLTGKKEDIDKVVKQYGASYQIEQSDSAMGYHINHSTYLYLIDQNGVLKNQFKHTEPVDTIANGIKRVIS